MFGTNTLESNCASSQYISLPQPTHSLPSLSIHLQFICLTQTVPQNIRSTSPTDFWKFPRECPTGTSYSGLIQPNLIILSATYLKASYLKCLKLWMVLPSAQLAKPENVTHLWLSSLSHSLHILSYHLWLILPLKCFLHRSMSIPHHYPVSRHCPLSWITLIHFLKVSLPLISPYNQWPLQSVISVL